MIIIFWLLSFGIYAADTAPTPNDFWIHYKAEVSIGEVHATLNRHRLVAREIESNPFRAHVSKSLTPELEEKLKKDIYVALISHDNTPLYPDHYYSAFGLTKHQRDNWTTGWMIAVPAILLGFGSTAWDWGKGGAHMGFGNEGWYSPNSYSGGADKMGHMTSHYIETRMTTWLAIQAGHDIKTANKIGLYTGAFVGLALEVGDGFSKYRFSTEDLFMDYLGVFSAWILDTYPALDEFIGIRWQWWPSREYRAASSKTKFDVTSDYSGQKVFLSLKAAGVPVMRENIFTRYLTLDFGYYTRGYEPDLTPDDKTDNIQRRSMSVGLGLNLGTLIFDSAPDSTAVRTAGGITKYWIPPNVTHAIKREEL
ncbi:MAG: hypothetical protein A2X86_08625 [Bdellovibrionales bacterium GWA2_49_15]|nr:MAG: hypothetical protein A2X86_08625 [Bdellovibrionales bacterium GWA2_49_15]HAZ11172.1 hypothetical protein [Bdellovibrionales bacterium]